MVEEDKRQSREWWPHWEWIKRLSWYEGRASTGAWTAQERRRSSCGGRGEGARLHPVWQHAGSTEAERRCRGFEGENLLGWHVNKWAAGHKKKRLRCFWKYLVCPPGKNIYFQNEARVTRKKGEGVFENIWCAYQIKNISIFKMRVCSPTTCAH